VRRRQPGDRTQGKPSNGLVRTFIMLVITAILMGAFAQFSAVRARNEATAAATSAIAASNRKWCHVLNLLDTADRSARPSTSAGRNLFGDFVTLDRQFGCSR
jgi:hypothetical protein